MVWFCLWYGYAVMPLGAHRAALFGIAGAGGLSVKLLDEQDGTTVSAIAFTSKINAAYKEYVFVFYDIHPQKKIHALVIPKGKYVDLDDFSQNAPPEEMVGLLKGLNAVAKKLGISVDTGKGYRALVNVSEHGGQEVPHLHFHLFGGEKVGKMVE